MNTNEHTADSVLSPRGKLSELQSWLRDRSKADKEEFPLVRWIPDQKSDPDGMGVYQVFKHANPT